MVAYSIAQQAPDEGSGLVLFGCGLILLLLTAMILTGIHVVPEHQRLVTFRFGVMTRIRGPGRVFLLPLGLERALAVDLREQTYKSQQTLTTRENAPVAIDLEWRHKVVDPIKYVLNVPSKPAIRLRDVLGLLGLLTAFIPRMYVHNVTISTEAVTEAIQSALRSTMENMAVSDVLFERDRIQGLVHSRLQGIMEPWGIEVVSVNIQESRSN